MRSMDGGLDLQHCSGSRAKRSRHQIGCQSVYLELLHPTGHNLRFVENPHVSKKNKWANLQKIGDKYILYLMYIYKSIKMGRYIYMYICDHIYLYIQRSYITNDGSTTSTTTHHQQEYINVLKKGMSPTSRTIQQQHHFFVVSLSDDSQILFNT